MPCQKELQNPSITMWTDHRLGAAGALKADGEVGGRRQVRLTLLTLQVPEYLGEQRRRKHTFKSKQKEVSTV